MTAVQYAQLLDFAQRIAHSEDEAQDLLQEALIVAIQKNRLDFSLDENQKWLFGVMRNKIKQEARTVARRHKRNQAFSSDHSQTKDSNQEEPSVESVNALNDFLQVLSPSARQAAVLIVHGLNRLEICTLLNLSKTAFRQRLTSIRKALGPLPPSLQQEVIALAYASRKERDERAATLPVGLIRKALLKSLMTNEQYQHTTIGTHDPSGHLIVVSSAHKKNKR